MTKSGRIGAAGEWAVAGYLTENGIRAEPRRLHGPTDHGDIVSHRDLAFQVKAGNAAKNASWPLIISWLQETQAQRENACAAYGFLVIQRKGYGIGRPGAWRTILLEDQLRTMLKLEANGISAPWETTLARLTALLLSLGYGND